MSSSIVHVVPSDGKWAVQVNGERDVISVHRIQLVAIMVGRELAKSRSAEFVVHRKDGGVRSIHRYGPAAPAHC